MDMNGPLCRIVVLPRPRPWVMVIAASAATTTTTPRRSATDCNIGVDDALLFSFLSRPTPRRARSLALLLAPSGSGVCVSAPDVDTGAAGARNTRYESGLPRATRTRRCVRGTVAVGAYNTCGRLHVHCGGVVWTLLGERGEGRGGEGRVLLSPRTFRAFLPSLLAPSLLSTIAVPRHLNQGFANSQKVFVYSPAISGVSTFKNSTALLKPSPAMETTRPRLLTYVRHWLYFRVK